MKSLREHRLKVGWTQAQVAEQLGVQPSAVTMWETGERKPNIIVLKRLADLFGCTTDELLKDIDVKNEKEDT